MWLVVLTLSRLCTKLDGIHKRHRSFGFRVGLGTVHIRLSEDTGPDHHLIYFNRGPLILISRPRVFIKWFYFSGLSRGLSLGVWVCTCTCGVQSSTSIVTRDQKYKSMSSIFGDREGPEVRRSVLPVSLHLLLLVETGVRTSQTHILLVHFHQCRRVNIMSESIRCAKATKDFRNRHLSTLLSCKRSSYKITLGRRRPEGSIRFFFFFFWHVISPLRVEVSLDRNH